MSNQAKKWFWVAAHVLGGAVVGAVIGAIDPDETWRDYVLPGVLIWGVIACLADRSAQVHIVREANLHIKEQIDD